ncbi:MAG: hypothetical protein R3247_05705 [Rhodothermales bacterium]|nr:hypothetical protein [Rhodothermales bacterium]
MMEGGFPAKIDQRAKTDAIEGSGTTERMLNDMTKYATEGVSGGLSFAISHIPLLGPVLAKGYDLSSAAALAAFYKKKLSEAATREDRIQYATSYLEASLAGDMRKAYNTLVHYDAALTTFLDAPPNDCQEAHKKLYMTHLADACVTDFREWSQILKTLADDLESLANEFTPRITMKKSKVEYDLGDLRHRHPSRKCHGLQRCYWVPDPIPVQGAQVPTRGGSVTVPNVSQHILDEDNL